MAIRDKSKAAGLFTSDFNIDEIDDLVKDSKKSSPFERKLEEERYEDFTCSDWKKYFALKAKCWGVKNFRFGDPRKESSVITSLMKNFSSVQIKEMIDFLWEADHDLVAHKQAMGIGMLSLSWQPTILALLPIWKKEGTLKPKDKRRRVIESDWEQEEHIPQENTKTPDKKKSRISI